MSDNISKKKTTYALKTPSVVAPTFIYAIEYALVPDRPVAERQVSSVSSVSSVTSWLLLNYSEIHRKTFFDLVTLTFDL